MARYGDNHEIQASIFHICWESIFIGKVSFRQMCRCCKDARGKIIKYIATAGHLKNLFCQKPCFLFRQKLGEG